MPRDNRLPSSDEMIRLARERTGNSLPPTQLEHPASGSEVEVGSDPEFIRPADRIASPPPPMRARPTDADIQRTPVELTPSPRRRGSWLLLVFAVPLILFAVLGLIGFIIGLLEDDPDVTDSIGGFVAVLVLTAAPGIYLVRRYRRGRAAVSTIR
jgi:hypothetical protein